MLWQRLHLLLAYFFIAGLSSHWAHAQTSPRLGGMRPNVTLPEPSPTPTPTAPPPQSLAQMGQDFENMGFANPHELPYREVEMWSQEGAGSEFVFNRPVRVVRTHGWVLPGKRKFVAWDGRIYQLRSVGRKSNWRMEIDDLLRQAEKPDARTRNKKKPSPNQTTVRMDDGLDIFKVVMLEILGEEELAHRAWAVYNTPQRQKLRGQNYQWGGRWVSRPVKEMPELPYRFEFAPDWIAGGFIQTVPLIIRGENATVLERLRIFVHACEVMGEKGDGPTMYADIYALHADYERRATDTDMPSNPYSMAFALWDLQNVGSPRPLGDTNIRQDVRYRRVVMRGNEAVEPLLATLTSDQRVSRLFYPAINSPVRVWEIAILALSEILSRNYKDVFHGLHYGNRVLEDDEWAMTPAQRLVNERKILARMIRADWEKVRSIPPRERPYEVLRDDGAGRAKWWEAANIIVRRESQQFYPSQTPMWGESLRTKQNPSVSELLARRSNEEARRDPRPSPSGLGGLAIPSPLAVDFALVLHQWDKEASAPVVLQRMRELAALDEEGKSRWAYQRDLIRLLRVAPRDEGSLIYANWLRALPRKKVAFSVFQPMWERRGNSLWQKVAEDLFSAPTSPWNTILSTSSPVQDAEDLSDNRDLIRVPAWNRLLQRDLGNKSSVGTIKRDRRKNLYFEDATKQTWRPSLSKKDEGKAKDSQADEPLRLCDLIACALFSSRSENSKWPRFFIAVPVKKRDAQIQKIIAWLENQSGKMANRKNSSSAFSRRPSAR